MSQSNYYNPPANFSRALTSETFINTLFNNVRTKLGRQLLKTEKIWIIQLVKNINPVILNKKKPEEISTILENKILKEITSQACGETDTVNIHEMLKNQIGITTDDGGVSTHVASADISTDPVVNYGGSAVAQTADPGYNAGGGGGSGGGGSNKKSVYIVMDTRYRILDDDGTKSFKWNFVNNTQTSQGSVNVVGDVKDISTIKIFPIKIPYVRNADNNYNRISMFINEFSAQSFVGQENSQFHFMFSTVIQDRYIELNAKDNGATFNFKTPITHLETFTITFGSPLQNIVFDPDRQNATITSYGLLTVFTCQYPHNILTGDLIYISNFNTVNPNYDSAIINGINSVSGSTISYIDNKTFSIEVDSSALTKFGNGTLSAINGNATINGVGTGFLSALFAGDNIVINGFVAGQPISGNYIIKKVVSDTVLTLETSYNENSNINLVYQRNNTISNLITAVYFASKRIFILAELVYN